MKNAQFSNLGLPRNVLLSWCLCPSHLACSHVARGCYPRNVCQRDLRCCDLSQRASARRSSLFKIFVAAILSTQLVSDRGKPLSNAAGLQKGPQPAQCQSVVAAGFGIPPDQYRSYARTLEQLLGFKVQIFQDGSTIGSKLTIIEGASKLVSIVELQQTHPAPVFLVGHSRGCKHVGEESQFMEFVRLS